VITSYPQGNVIEMPLSLLEKDQRAFDRLTETASELVLFGSRASGANSNCSDWDLLFVGDAKPHGTGQLDIVWKTAKEIDETKWLGSELANHIAEYGITLCGAAKWTEATYVSQESIERKRRRLGIRASGLWDYWERLHPDFRGKHLTTIRREVQRLQFLTGGFAVPSTPTLDKRWTDDAAEIDRWSAFTRTLKIEGAQAHERFLRTAELIITGPRDTKSVRCHGTLGEKVYGKPGSPITAEAFK
jgi:hypothetical protein